MNLREGYMHGSEKYVLSAVERWQSSSTSCSHPGCRKQQACTDHSCNVRAQQKIHNLFLPRESTPHNTSNRQHTDQYYPDCLLDQPPIPFTNVSQSSRPYLPYRMAITSSFAHFTRAITEMFHSVISFVTGVLFRWPIQVIVELVNILAGLIHSVLGFLTGEPQWNSWKGHAEEGWQNICFLHSFWLCSDCGGHSLARSERESSLAPFPEKKSL